MILTAAGTLSSFSSIAGITGVIIAVTVGLAGVTAYFRGSYGRQTIDTLKTDNDALRGRLATVEAEQVRVQLEMQTKIDVLTVANAHLEQRLKALNAVVTAKDDIDDLRLLIIGHHTELMTALGKRVGR